MSQTYSEGSANHYIVLGLAVPQSPDQKPPTIDVLRAAYRQALLRYHPDRAAVQKRSKVPAKAVSEEARHSVDAIVQAYETLANPTSRAAYDDTLLKATSKARIVANNKDKQIVALSLETVDLEDLDYHEASSQWSKGCRCGSTYTVSEQQLEDVADEGEVIVGCQGCSLCIRVVFHVI